MRFTLEMGDKDKSKIEFFLNFIVLITCSFVILFSCKSAQATLVISIYNNDAIYLGSDSLVSHLNGTAEKRRVRKVFTLDKTCSVSIVGLNGGPVGDIYTGRLTNISIAAVLGSTCKHLLASEEPLQSKITNVLSRVGSAYKDYNLRRLQKTGNPETATG